MELREFVHNSAGYWLTVQLRDKILRKPLGLSFSEEELLAEHDSHHLAIVENNHIIACLVLKPLSQTEMKMRQVAVDTTHQGKGIGTRLVEVAEEFSRDLNFEIMSCHARNEAVDFYEQMNYEKVGGLFFEVGLEHYKMVKYFRNLHNSI